MFSNFLDVVCVFFFFLTISLWIFYLDCKAAVHTSANINQLNSASQTALDQTSKQGVLACGDTLLPGSGQNPTCMTELHIFLQFPCNPLDKNLYSLQSPKELSQNSRFPTCQMLCRLQSLCESLSITPSFPFIFLQVLLSQNFL